MAVEVARLGVECKYWPLYEVIDGEYTINYTPKKEVPVSEWMFLQGRFKHLSKPAYSDIIDAIQKEVERNWHWLARQAASNALLSAEVN
jgi:pyruvate ferredoxin oxidoreductase beta subunit